VHLLVYFVSGHGALNRLLRDTREDRKRRNGELLDRLRWLGMPLDPTELAAEAGPGVIGRPHFAALLVRRGHATSVADAFDRYLGEGRPAYVERAPLAPAAVIELASNDDAVVSLAHPLSAGLDPRELSRYVASLADVGLVGLESIYGRYDRETRETLSALARRSHLVPTGGSDFHGSYKPELSVGTGLGDLDVPDELVGELRARRSGAA
jgi:predicted metal-dependent phosphoesterase TrpH